MAIACISAMGQTAVGSAKPLPLDQQIAALVADPAVARAHWA